VPQIEVEKAWRRIRHTAANMARGRKMLRVEGPSEEALALETLRAAGIDVKAALEHTRAALARTGIFIAEALARRRRLVVRASFSIGAALLIALVVAAFMR
jgi:hypothetical protein